jgi:hypothetical protein
MTAGALKIRVKKPTLTEEKVHHSEWKLSYLIKKKSFIYNNPQIVTDSSLAIGCNGSTLATEQDNTQCHLSSSQPTSPHPVTGTDSASLTQETITAASSIYLPSS